VSTMRDRSGDGIRMNSYRWLDKAWLILNAALLFAGGAVFIFWLYAMTFLVAPRLYFLFTHG